MAAAAGKRGPLEEDGTPATNRAGHERAAEGRVGGMLREFQKFLFRGNLMDLAVAVVIGTAFGGVVTALVKDLLTPLIAALVGQPNFSKLSFTVHHSTFAYGDFINALVSFVLVAAAVFYAVVVPTTMLTKRLTKPAAAPPPPATKACPECCSQIPAAARRCAFCTSVVA